MFDKIVKKLGEIEKQSNITIVYACESGSRAWGFASPNSDYDVRFIFVRNLKEYLTIYDKKDTIELPIENDLDFSGWDIRKYLLHLHKSNGVMFEWLQSPIVYNESNGFKSKSLSFMEQYFRPKATMNHYLGLTKRTFLGFEGKSKVKIKKYFYILRPILAARFIYDNKTVPPMEFNKLLDSSKTIMPVSNLVKELLIEKEKNEEAYLIPRVSQIDKYVEEELNYLSENSSSLEDNRIDSDNIDNFLFELIKECSNGY